MENDSLEDSSCWRGTSQGHFIVQSAYDMINKSNIHEPEYIWKNIWRLKVPNRICAFLWLLSHKKIMSNDTRVKRTVVALYA